MDIATHFVVPYAAALAALGFWRRDAPRDRERAGIAAVVGLSGFAPDIDGLVDRASEWSDSLYWLQHRGVSHTLIGAPVFALALTGLLLLLARWKPAWFGGLRWRLALIPAMVLGAWSHLLLDAVTYGGVPMFWPFSFHRVMFPWFHWLVIWLLPIGAIVLVLNWWGKLSPRGVVVAGALIVATLVVLAGLREAARPEGEPEGTVVLTRNTIGEWVVLRPLPNGTWEAHLYVDGERSRFTYYPDDAPAAAADAVARAVDTDAYRGFLMGSFGPRVTRAEPEPGGGWNVTITDVAQRFEASLDPRWAPTQPVSDWGYVAFTVRGAEVHVTHRGW